jgi:hypothetical protein
VKAVRCGRRKNSFSAIRLDSVDEEEEEEEEVVVVVVVVVVWQC